MGLQINESRLKETVLAALIVLLGSKLVRAADLDDSAISCVHQTADTNQILPRVKSGLSTIPASIKDALFKEGYKIIITPTMLYGKGSDDLERRSNYDVGSSNNIAGQYRSSEHAVYIPEKASYRNEPPRLQGDDLIHVLRHEFGHAYDFYLHHASSSDQFMQAYNEDSSKLTNSQRTNFSYFSMQEPGTSSTELFAELFSILCTSGDYTLRPVDKGLYEAFPHCISVMRSINPDLKPHSFGSSSTSATTATNQSTPSSTKTSSPSASASALTTGSTLVANRHYAEAIPYLDAVIKADPTNVMAYNYRAYAFLATGNYSGSISDYQMVIRLDPKDQSAAANLELAKTMAGKLKH